MVVSSVIFEETFDTSTASMAMRIETVLQDVANLVVLSLESKMKSWDEKRFESPVTPAGILPILQ
jgi:hypothetical protein